MDIIRSLNASSIAGSSACSLANARLCSLARAGLRAPVRKLTVRTGSHKLAVKAEVVGSQESAQNNTEFFSQPAKQEAPKPTGPTAAQWRELTRKTRVENIDMFCVDGEVIQISTFRPL